MAGHMGCDVVTVEKVEVVKVVPEDNLILLNGSVPGTDGGIVYVKETSKPKKKRVKAAVQAGGSKKVKKGAAPAQKKAAKPKK